MNPDGTNVRRVTVDGIYADAFPALTPDGKKTHRAPVNGLYARPRVRIGRVPMALSARGSCL
jgi:hypothetical protein